MTDPPSRIISIRTQSMIPLGWLPHLDAILTRSTGYDHLLWIRESKTTVPRLGHLPLYCARAVAEQAMTFWMVLLRRLSTQQIAFRTFHRDGLTGREAKGRRLAVIGVGQIGVEVVDIGRSLGMDVVGVDLVEKHSDVLYASPEDALSGAEVVVAAMNLIEENRGYFSQDAHHLQFNVVTAEKLRQAQRNPQEHRHLIVRVAGYSDYFCDLSLELQNEIIERTEHDGF